VELLDPTQLESLLKVERDAHDHIRLAEINFAEILKMQVQERLANYGIKTTIIAKNIGYELRCADPIPFDMEYTRDLGYCAARHVLTGGNAAIVSIREGHFLPLAFKDVLHPQTGKMKVRMVDISSAYYQIGRLYMLRLTKNDFDDPYELAKLAAVAGVPMEEFRGRFQRLIELDMHYKAQPNLTFQEPKGEIAGV